MTTTRVTDADVVVAGAGVIGLAVAWEVAATGARVVVCDPSPATGASWAAAGMLAPVTESRIGEDDLVALGVASLALWPDFAARLEVSSGRAVGLRTEGTLAVGVDEDDRRALDELAAVHRHLGLASERLAGGACRALEPSLHPRLRAGLLVPGDHQVDPRAVLDALLIAAGTAGVEMCTVAVGAVLSNDDRVTGVDLVDGSAVVAPAVVVAAGCRSGALGLPGPAPGVPVRPVKGQVLRLRADPLAMPVTRTIRALVHGWPVYLVPRRSGELVVGATMEERGFDTTVTAGAVHDLLRAAIEVIPEIAELELVESTARLRPATPDNGPLLGPGPVAGLIHATGHHRSGVLLAPITVETVLATLAQRPVPDAAAAFDPKRFS
ncbi:MAG: glycine oxidase ThiO [Actinomycetota bacterium]|nr:glycine oxidase ThiO [Actinomycetota bacterium]